MVFANRAHNCCLRSLVSESLGKSHFLPDLETVEFAVGHTVAMKIDLAPVSRRNKSVIALWYEQTDDAVRGHLMSLNMALSLAHEILQLAARSYAEPPPVCPMSSSLRKQLGSKIQTFNFRTPMEKTSRLPIGGGK